MRLPHAQLIPLPRLLHSNRFSSDHNTSWLLLQNHDFMINPNIYQNPLIQEADSSFDGVHATTTHAFFCHNNPYSHIFMIVIIVHKYTYLLCLP
jgi:hypothetical protein